MSIMLDAIVHTAIDPALKLLPSQMDSDAARVMLLSIGQQESRFAYRYQQVPGDPYAKGPARGFWQNERGGVQCLFSNAATKEEAEALCKARGIPADSTIAWTRLEFDDVLAAGFARLFLWADPHPVPPVDADHDTAWDCYVRNWRPGRPRRETWDAFHAAAHAQVMS